MGRGGFGAVYKALQADLGRVVAVKVLRKDSALANDGLARFAREARAAAALGHPNIVQVLDFQLLPNEPPFIVLEHLEGQTLGTRLRQEPRLEVRRVCAIAHQVLLALEAAHASGIVHRDIKPDNVFLLHLPGIEDFVKLLDFGIAKLQDPNATSLTDVGSMVGTPAFMAPEQIVNVGVDHRADIYGVGALLYYALAGRHPFEAPNVSALVYAIAHTKATSLVSLNPTLDPALALVIERAMHKDPQARFSSAAEMRAALAPWSQVSGASPLVPPMDPSTAPTMLATRSTVTEGPTRVVTPPSKRTGLIVAIVGVVLVLLLLLGAGIVGVFIHLHQDEESPTASVAKPPPVVATTSTVVATASATVPSKTATPSPPKPSPTPSPTPSPSPAPSPTTSAKRMGARTAKVSLGDCTFDLAECQAAIAPVIPAAQACFAATEFDPPQHEVADYSIMLDKTGAVTEVQRHKSGENVAHPKLDACIASAIAKAKYPRSPSNTRVEVLFRARL